LAVVFEWLRAPHPCGPHELAEAITALLPNWFAAPERVSVQVDLAWATEVDTTR